MKRIINTKTPIISVVIPFFNEEGNVKELYRKLINVISLEKKYIFEIIAVEHGSTDDTLENLQTIRKKDKRLKILQLSKNFGSADAGIAAGLNFAKGDAVIIIMADLQEPPALIPDFLRKWENGYDIIYGIVKKRMGISKSREIASILYYKILNSMTGNIFPENVSDFRLIDKAVCKAVCQMQEKNKFLRGMIIWTGFKQIGIPFQRAPRYSGKSKADTITVIKVALNGILSFSYLPLRFVALLGFILSLVSFFMIIFQIILFFSFGRGAPGISTIVVLISFLFGMLFLILGVIGEYIGRIYDEVKQRPSFIVKNKFGL